MKIIIKIISLGLIFIASSLFAQTIAEKKASFSQSSSDLNKDMQKYLAELNKEHSDYQDQLHMLYQEVEQLYGSDADENEYQDLLYQINEIRNCRVDLEQSWQQISCDTASGDGYALWHQPETTIGQLVIDYGSQNYVYMVSPEIASIKISIDSNLPIPRSSWDEMLELILAQNGVGYKQINPYLRQLYLFKQDRSGLRMITNCREDLEILPPEARVLFMISPETCDVKRVWVFLEKFVNPNSTVLQMIGRDILIVAPVSDVKELLKLYDFVSCNRGDRDYKIIPLRRINPEEMGKILSAVFDQTIEPSPSFDKPGNKAIPIPPPVRFNKVPAPESKSVIDAGGLRMIPLHQNTPALFLYGTREEIKKAESVIREVEGNMGGPREKLIYWYTTRHSDPIELADILVKVYTLMSKEQVSLKLKNQAPGAPGGPQEPHLPSPEPVEMGVPPPPPPYNDSYYMDDRFVINSSPRDEKSRPIDPNHGRSNFIVDPKTGAIVMVVEADLLPKMKELIRKLDIPKKMVQIEVLLFEKKLSNRNNMGLNLLKIGSDACNKTATGLDFNFFDHGLFKHLKLVPDCLGITTFFISRKKTSMMPAYDAVYQFLLSQDDITINANPSVLTLNQTEAHIAIEEEISVNTGAVITPGTVNTAVSNTYQRARYGIKIDITPIIHMRNDGFSIEGECICPEDEDDIDYITLQTDLVFETIHGGFNPEQPDVTRRVINNEVRIPDGQTVILGGLRRKVTEDCKESIPFIGEIPGLGKLFSTTKMSDHSVEMFIFITPKIIKDPKEELELYRYVELTRRPGDIPSFLCALEEARNEEKNRLLHGTMQLLFGREPERCGPIPQGEYDGRCW